MSSQEEGGHEVNIIDEKDGNAEHKGMEGREEWRAHDRDVEMGCSWIDRAPRQVKSRPPTHKKNIFDTADALSSVVEETASAGMRQTGVKSKNEHVFRVSHRIPELRYSDLSASRGPPRGSRLAPPYGYPRSTSPPSLPEAAPHVVTNPATIRFPPDQQCLLPKSNTSPACPNLDSGINSVDQVCRRLLEFGLMSHLTQSFAFKVPWHASESNPSTSLSSSLLRPNIPRPLFPLLHFSSPSLSSQNILRPNTKPPEVFPFPPAPVPNYINSNFNFNFNSTFNFSSTFNFNFNACMPPTGCSPNSTSSNTDVVTLVPPSPSSSLLQSSTLYITAARSRYRDPACNVAQGCKFQCFTIRYGCGAVVTSDKQRSGALVT
ncbi:hypothetical protein C8R44DRAFT_735173 [Mycena epipterygia]|nr:hypothetical protein C8R44DRAFT_735173 [Mycena epipterygia]